MANTLECMGELTRFEVECLIAVAQNPMERGLVVRDALAEVYGEQINHGRLYPNLDALAERGLLVKHSQHQDNRSNAYEITTDGIKRLEELEARIEGGLEQAYVSQ